MRESFTYGSVRGAGSNPSPYRDRCSAYVLGGRLRGRTRDSGFDTTATESTLNRPATGGDQLIGLIFHMSG
jgi:hypothetical protein